MSATVVFAGPTITAAEVREVLGDSVLVLGPARQGDVMRARRLGAAVIAIIDGFFQSVPAVWHKEILWAIADGAHVLGAASMGALRAAELHSFGMVGVGRIFERFRDGELTRDDEVAVAHAAADNGYRPLSEALVNIRATVDAALAASVLDGMEAAWVVEEAARLFYPERHWPAVRDALAAHAGPDAGARLDRFVRDGGRVDQKRQDALELLATLRHEPHRWATPKSVGFTLAHTVWFDHLHVHAGQFRRPDQTVVGVSETDIDDELRLHRHFRPALRATLLRHLAAQEANRRGLRAGPEQIAGYANEVCRDLGLHDQASFDRWLADNELSLAAFNELMATELRRSMVMTEISRVARPALDDGLRLAGLWPAVTGRAARKVQLLDEAGLADPGLEHTGLASHEELVAWWLQRLGQADDAADPAQLAVELDVDAVARQSDFADRDQFLQALLREYCAASLGLDRLDDEGQRW